MTRVVAGTFGGRRLSTPRAGESAIRPTTDRVKTILFDLLGPLDGGVTVLDAFAGTAALGIEALSRGASEATFVDGSALAVRLMHANIAALDLGFRTSVVRGDVFAFADRALAAGRTWSLVLADPPYGEPRAAAVVERLGGLVTPGGRLVIEHATDDAVPDRAGPLVSVRRRPAGGTELVIYRRANAEPDNEEG